MSYSSDPVVSRAHRQVIGVLLLIAAVVTAGAIFTVLLTGGAAAEQVTNETIQVENDSNVVFAEVTFANVSDANATADVIVTDPSGTELANETFDGNGSESVYAEWSVDEPGDYTVVVEAANGTVEDTLVGDGTASSGGGGGLLGGSSKIVVAIVAIVGAGALAARADG